MTPSKSLINIEADTPPPKPGRSSLEAAENAENLIFQGDLAEAVPTVHDASNRNDSETPTTRRGNRGEFVPLPFRTAARAHLERFMAASVAEIESLTKGK